MTRNSDGPHTLNNWQDQNDDDGDGDEKVLKEWIRNINHQHQ